MLPPFQHPSQLKLCGNHFKTRSSGNCVRGHVHLQCRGVEEVWVCTISSCNCCEILLSRSIYYYVKLKSAWFPAVSACAEGLVSIVTNIKELAGTSVWSSIWACSAVPCSPVRVLDGWQASRQVCGCHYYSSGAVRLGIHWGLKIGFSKMELEMRRGDVFFSNTTPLCRQSCQMEALKNT